MSDQLELEYNTVSDMVCDGFSKTYDFLKHDAHKNGGKVTGQRVLLNKCENPPVIIDIDIKHELPESEKSAIRDGFMDILLDLYIDFPVKKSRSGGMHIICLDDPEFPATLYEKCAPTSNCWQKCIETEQYDVDIIRGVNKNKSQGIMWAGRAKSDNETDDKIGRYCWLNGNDYSMVKYKYSYILDILHLTEKLTLKPKSEPKPQHKLSNEHWNHIESGLSEDDKSRELIDIVIDGLLPVLIHRQSGAGIGADIEVAIPQIVADLYSCINQDITVEYITQKLQYIKDNGTLSEKCAASWDTQKSQAIEDYNNHKIVGYHLAYCTKGVRYHNSEYFTEHILPKVNKYIPNAEDFINAKYSLSDYKSVYGNFKYTYQYINNLVKCLAFIDDGRYIIKERTPENTISFNIISEKELKTKLNFDMVIKNSPEDIEKQRRQKKRITETKSVSIFKYLAMPQIMSRFKNFISSDIMGDDKNIFSEFRPPNPNYSYTPIQYKPELIENWLKLVYDQMYDEYAIAAMEHFIKINAYLLQVHKKSQVFFIKYSKLGHTGKSWIDLAFKTLYGVYALIELTEDQSNEKHNGGLVGKLYRGRDELTSDNRKSKSANANIKRITNDYISARRMNQDTKQEKDMAIDVLNLNEPDLYGMLTSNDIALLSRLCIIRFKERVLKESEYAHFNNVIHDPNFAYSLYTYLMNIDLTKFIENESYDRYDSSAVQAQLMQLLPKTSLQDFIETSELPWIEHKFRYEPDTIYEIVKSVDLRSEYIRYMGNSQYKLSFPKLDEELAKYGIERYTGGGGQVKIHGVPHTVYRRIKPTINTTDMENIDNYNGIEASKIT